MLLAEIQRSGNEGIGKPEALKHDFAGCWSRRITDEHRLVYKVVDNEVRSLTVGTAAAAPANGMRSTSTNPSFSTRAR